MKQYRLVETAPIDGKRYGQSGRTTLWKGPDKAGLKQAINTWCAAPRKPYAETSYYYGSTRIYAYEL